jgi:fatty-acyl-CoA synthase
VANTANITQNLIRAYYETPDKLAVTLLFNGAPEIQLTYQQLIQRSYDYAKCLSEIGVRTGEVVILILQHSPDLLAAFLGTILHGAVPSIMPFLTEKLLPEYYRQSLKSLFEISSPSTVITYPQFLSEVKAATGNATSVRQIIDCTLVKPSPQLITAQLPGKFSKPGDIALLQHSSGTTGLQKGVALSHQAIFNQLSNYSSALRLDHTDVIVSWLPLYHDMGLIAGFLLPILSQLHLVLLSPFDWVRAPYRLLQAISNYKGTLCWLPNFAYNFCAQKIRDRDIEQVNLESLRAIINCSEPMHPESHQQFLQRFQPYGLKSETLATCYAMAENVFAVTQGGIDHPITVDHIDSFIFSGQQIAHPVKTEIDSQSNRVQKILSAGKPISNTLIRILDANGNILPERHVGEISLNSNCMLDSYFNRPDLTKQAFLNGWYLTGDLGYLADGELFVTGRKKDLIIIGGKNIYPQDLERLVNDVDGVHPGRVVAVGIFDETSGTEEAVIIAEVNHYIKLTREECENIINLIRQKVTQGSDITLRRVYLVSSNWLMKTSSGKIARSANRQKYLQEIN